MAAQGYIVVAPNRRGLPSFGQEWLDQISGDYSGQNIRDYLSAIDDVAREPWADDDRMGCVGASYGGYSVYFLAGCHEKRFKAFIAHCGIFDFDSMYGETEELWFVNNDYGGPTGTRQMPRRSVPMPTRRTSSSRWDTPILIFTGEKDFRIPYTRSRIRSSSPQNSMVWNREFFGWLEQIRKITENPTLPPEFRKNGPLSFQAENQLVGGPFVGGQSAETAAGKAAGS